MPSLAKYEIVEPVGAGPWGAVYRGRQTSIDVPVAIKQLHPSLSPGTKQRLLAAVDRCAQAASDHLLPIRDVDPSRDWIVTDLMRGNLGDVLSRGPVEPAAVHDVLVDCLTALEYLHSRQGRLHANIKPTNILYDHSGRVRLGDGFLVANGAGADLPVRSAGFKYFAPEMLGEGDEPIGPAADLYCLGLVMLEALVGPRFSSLFRNVSDDPNDQDRAWVRWHLTPSQTAPRAADQVERIQHQFATVIDRLLCKDLVQRYRSARDALDDLKSSDSSRHESRSSSDSAPERNFRPAAERQPGVGVSPNSIPGPSVGRYSEVSRPQFSGSQPSAPRPGEQPVDAAPVISDPLALISPRPTTPVVLWIVSGADAGQMVGLTGYDLCVGDGAGSNLRFAPAKYPTAAGCRIRLRREADQWVLRNEGSKAVFVNRQLVDEAAPLRSGDIVRMTAWGPDFQFILQNPNEQSLAALASAFLEPHQAAAIAQSAHGSQRMPAIVSTPGGFTPAPPVGPTQAVRSAAPSPPMLEVVSRPSYAPAPPMAPQLERQPKSKGKASAAAVADASASPPQNPAPRNWKTLYDYKHWNKKTQNWVVAIVASLIAILIVYLVPTGGPAKPDGAKNESSQTRTNHDLPTQNHERSP